MTGFSSAPIAPPTGDLLGRVCASQVLRGRAAAGSRTEQVGREWLDQHPGCRAFRGDPDPTDQRP